MTRRTNFFEGYSWVKFNNLGLALGMALDFYTSVAKGLKLKVKKFLGLIPTFAKVTEEKLAGGAFYPHILNRVKTPFFHFLKIYPWIVYDFLLKRRGSWLCKITKYYRVHTALGKPGKAPWKFFFYLEKYHEFLTIQGFCFKYWFFLINVFCILGKTFCSL